MLRVYARTESLQTRNVHRRSVIMNGLKNKTLVTLQNVNSIAFASLSA